MKKAFSVSIFSIFVLTFLTGCPSKVAPVSERIAKVWIAQSVDENSSTVYTRNGTSNVRNYASFKLDLSKPPTVQYTAFDGNTFTGQYSLPNDQTLTLSNLNPQPTGSNGTITFTINSIDGSTLIITQQGTSQKTGNTTNKYTLTAQ